MKKKVVFGRSALILLIIVVVSLGLNVYQYIHIMKDENNSYDEQEVLAKTDSDTTITQIEQFLDSISPAYIADEQVLAKQYQIPSLGCGPSSYAMAQIIDKKFFNNKLIITGSYNYKDPYAIVERFGLAQGDGPITDHAWLEIYFNDKFLFIDPSISQFGKINKIAYQVFNVNDPTVSDTLKTNYGITDIRLSILVQKALDRIPAAQQPYPGDSIDPSVVPYYIQIQEDHNDLNNGIEPTDWLPWSNILLNKY